MPTILQVQSLRLTLTLCLKNPLPRSSEIGHLNTHSSFSKSQETSLGANCLDIRTGKIILLIDELLEIDIFIQGHLGGMEGEDLALGDLIGVLEEDLTIDTTGTDEGGVESIDFVGSHDNLDISTIIETIQLIEEFQHSSLDFSLSTRCRLVTFRTNSIDFINEDNGWGILSGNLNRLAQIK